MKFIHVILAAMAIFIFSNHAFSQELVSPFVEFEYQEKIISVTAREINKNSFVYNEGAKKKISITTLDWAPYIAQEMCGQGWVQQFTIALLASKGYEITSKFLPWARTIHEAETGNAAILYPEYYIESAAQSDVVPGTKRLDHLSLSKKFPGGPIAFLKRKGEQDNYTGSFLSLKGEKIGVVRGYQNTPEFDKFMDEGLFKISKAVDDLMNVVKLEKKRVNLIIGDPAVIFYNLSNSSFAEERKNKILNSIEVVQPVIQYNYLYFAVSKKYPGWQGILADINQAIQEFEESGLMHDIIKKTNARCRLNMDESLKPYSGAYK
ncbi:MAG: amino acid ABC transporter substrate-binding protein [Desulfobacteraceae bacterium]|nr:amino acid ABC transporter substrate-binding protein [Desulfobacteraceae bacterium]